MSGLDPTAWLGAGIVIGWLFTWLVLRSKAADAYQHGQAEGESEKQSERAVALERAAASERALAEAKGASAARIAELDERMAKLGAENAAHLARQAELATRLEE